MWMNLGWVTHVLTKLAKKTTIVLQMEYKCRITYKKKRTKHDI